MRGVEGEVKKPRLRVAGVARDGCGGLFAEAGGELADLGHGGGVAQDRGGLFGVRGRRRLLAGADFHFSHGARKVAMAAPEKTEVVVEAAAVGVKVRMGTEVPFADGAGGVAGGAESIRDGRLGERQAVGGGGGVPFGIILVAEALLITAGQEAGARRAADRIGHVTVGAAEAGSGEAVEVRRGNVAGALKAHVIVAEIVGDN